MAVASARWQRPHHGLVDLAERNRGMLDTPRDGPYLQPHEAAITTRCAVGWTDVRGDRRSVSRAGIPSTFDREPGTPTSRCASLTDPVRHEWAGSPLSSRQPTNPQASRARGPRHRYGWSREVRGTG